MAVTIEDIKKLKELTGIGLTDAKQALVDAEGDFDKALEALRKKGLTKAEKKGDRETREGLIESYVHGGRIGVIAEVNCETDFVARSDAFRKLAHELALQIAASSPLYVKEEDIPADVIEHEAQIATNKAREEGKGEAVIPRIVEGSLKKYKDEFVLMRQPYIRDESITVQELVNQNLASIGENIVIRRFARWALGEESGSEE